MRQYKRYDYGQVAQWYLMRNMAPPPKWMLPKHGVIVDEVAIGFLVITNNHMGILEFFVSNPKAKKEDKNAAFDEITHVLLLSAKKMGLRIVRCDSQIDSVKRRAVVFGFKSLGQSSFFSREL